MIGFTNRYGVVFTPLVGERFTVVTIDTSQVPELMPGAHSDTLATLRKFGTQEVPFEGPFHQLQAKLFLAVCTCEFLFLNSLGEHLERAAKLFEQMDTGHGFAAQQVIYKGCCIWIRDDEHNNRVELEFEPGMGTTQARIAYKDAYDAYATLYAMLCMLENRYLGRPQPRERAIECAKAKLLAEADTLDLASAIFGTAMRGEGPGNGDLGASAYALRQIVEEISPELHAELQKQGTQHPLAHVTLTNLRKLSEAAALVNEGLEQPS